MGSVGCWYLSREWHRQSWGALLCHICQFSWRQCSQDRQSKLPMRSELAVHTVPEKLESSIVRPTGVSLSTFSKMLSREMGRGRELRVYVGESPSWQGREESQASSPIFLIPVSCQHPSERLSELCGSNCLSSSSCLTSCPRSAPHTLKWVEFPPPTHFLCLWKQILEIQGPYHPDTPPSAMVAIDQMSYPDLPLPPTRFPHPQSPHL